MMAFCEIYEEVIVIHYNNHDNLIISLKLFKLID